MTNLEGSIVAPSKDSTSLNVSSADACPQADIDQRPGASFPRSPFAESRHVAIVANNCRNAPRSRRDILSKMCAKPSCDIGRHSNNDTLRIDSPWSSGPNRYNRSFFRCHVDDGAYGSEHSQ
jgi:hypothetical protein